MKNAVLLLLVGGLAMAQVKVPPKRRIIVERIDFVVSPVARGEQKRPGIRIEVHGKPDFTTADVVVRVDGIEREYGKTTWKMKDDFLVVALDLDPELKGALAKAKQAEITITPLFSVEHYVVKFTEQQLADFRGFFHENSPTATVRD